MHDEDTKKLVQLYEDRFHAQGADITTLGWKNREEQELRFKVLCDVGELHGTRLCDVGCGFGDLYQYLGGSSKEVSYVGLDISPSLLEHARAKYPKASFLEVDLDVENYDGEHDYVVSSGALSFKRADNLAHADRMIAKMFSLARQGVAINFLSTYVNYQNRRNFHYSPEEIFGMARKYTKWVKIRHDYPLWEFTLYMYKEAQK